MEEVSSERFREDIGHHTFAINMDQGDVLEFLNLLPEEGNTRGDVFEPFRGSVVIGELHSGQVVAEYRRGLFQRCSLDKSNCVAYSDG